MFDQRLVMSTLDLAVLRESLCTCLTRVDQSANPGSSLTPTRDGLYWICCRVDTNSKNRL